LADLAELGCTVRSVLREGRTCQRRSSGKRSACGGASEGSDGG